MTTRHARKHPDAPPPPAPALKVPASDSEEVAALRKEVERLHGLLKWHTGKSDYP